MISIDPPSFSLGFDLDAPSGLDPGLTVSDSDLELEPDFPSPVLKRLRRGIKTNCAKNDDQDIQEFSSQEDFDAPTSTRSRFSSNSMVSLTRTSGVLTNQPSSSISGEKRKRLDVVPSSGISSVSSLFQRSTCSPLRRFQLLDSDSDDNQHPKDQQSVASKAKKRKESGSMQSSGDLWKDFSL